MPKYGSKSRYPTAASIIESFPAEQEAWLNRVLEHAGQLPQEDVQKLRCMFGEAASTNELIGSNAVERGEMVPRVARALNELVSETGGAIAKVTVADVNWRAPLAALSFDVTQLRLARTILKKLGDASIGVVRFGYMPVADTPENYELYACVHAIVVVRNARETIPVAAASLQRRHEAPRFFTSPITLSYPKASNERVITAAAASLLDMNDPFATLAKQQFTRRRAREWRRTGSARAYERFKILSLCKLDRLMLATGSLEPLLASLRAGAQARVRKCYQMSDKPLHPDAIVHFWAKAAAASENVELRLPFIKQRS